MAANPQPLDAYLAQLTSIEQHDTRGRLGAVTCPAMTLVGARTSSSTRSSRAGCTTSCRARTWVEVPGGHGCLWEYPDAFNRAVLEFLASVG